MAKNTAPPATPPDPYAKWSEPASVLSALPPDFTPDADAGDTATTLTEPTVPEPLPGPLPRMPVPEPEFRPDADPLLVRAFKLLDEIANAQLLVAPARWHWTQCYELANELRDKLKAKK